MVTYLSTRRTVLPPVEIPKRLERRIDRMTRRRAITEMAARIALVLTIGSSFLVAVVYLLARSVAS